MTAKRRLLIVTDWSCSKFSALKRGLVYAPFFAANREWSVEYIDRHPPQDAGPASLRRQRSATGFGQRLSRYLGAGTEGASPDEEILKCAREFDLIYLLKTPTADLQQRLLEMNGPRIVVDVNDALWLPHHGNGFSRLDEMLTTAHGVICENSYGEHHVRTYNPRTRIVPDCTQLETFDAWRGSVARDPGKVRLGYIGSHSTASFLYAIWEPLEELFTRHQHLELRILGASEGQFPPFEAVRWSAVADYDRELMVKEALAMDIGLFPLFKVENSFARGNGKAVVYMAAGAVAACSNLGEHTKLIQNNVNGVLASTPDEWLARLDRLVTDAAERVRIGQAGLATIRRELTDQHCFDHLVGALNFFMEARP